MSVPSNTSGDYFAASPLPWERLQKKSVCVVGLGRLGAPVVLSLLEHGVGRVDGFDPDVCSARNAVGQPWEKAHIEQRVPKAHALREIVSRQPQSAKTNFCAQSFPPAHEVTEGFFEAYDLLVLAADDFRRVLPVAHAFVNTLPIVLGFFHREVAGAEVAFSVPHATAPLTNVFGRREELRGIGQAKALGTRTRAVAAFVAELCLTLLLDGDGPIPLRADSPFYLFDFVRGGLGRSLPPDVIECVVRVQPPPHSHRR